MNLAEIIELVESYLEQKDSIQIDEKLVIRTTSTGLKIVKVICQKGEKKHGTICVPMTAQETMTKIKQGISKHLTYQRDPRILRKAATKRHKAAKFGY